MSEINTKCYWKSPILIIWFSSHDELTADAWSLSLVLITVFYSFCLIWKHVALINNQPADSAVRCSEIILMAARNNRVFQVRVHVYMDMFELENIVRCSSSQIKYVFRLENVRVTCHLSKLTNSLEKQRLQFSTRKWSWNRGKFVLPPVFKRANTCFVVLPIFELVGTTKHLMIGPSENIKVRSREKKLTDSLRVSNLAFITRVNSLF